MVSDKQKKSIIDILVTEISPHFIVLFGSYAKENKREHSDIDLAYLSDKTLSPYEIFMVGQKIASKLNVEIDLLDLKNASTVMQVQALLW